MLCLSLGQWAILIRTMMVVQASWDDQVKSCVVVNTNHVLLAMNYAYSKWPEFSAIPRGSFNISAVVFDFVILVMTIYALAKRFRREALSSLLFRDGLVYFLVTATCNSVPAVGPLL
jgi:hypothetical protein